MKTRIMMSITLVSMVLIAHQAASAAPWGLPELSQESKACADCHKTEDAAIYQQWGNSKHYRANVGCYECHAAKQGETDVFEHEGQWIATIVSPKDCARCHEKEAKEFADSHHSTPKAGGSSGR